MTLLLNLIGPSGIHQSSDYRLTDVVTRRPIEDIFGSKQLQFAFFKWNAHISFTGIAEIAGRKTRDWISQTLSSAPLSAEVTTVIADLAARATTELRSMPRRFRQLTIVVTISEAGRAARLFVISCVDRPGRPPLADALDHFEVYEFSSDKPRVLIFGSTSAVSSADRKLLKDLSRGRRDPAENRAALAAINSRSAKRSLGLISEGCLVTTVLSGNTASENFGTTPGIPADTSTELAELIAKSLPGKRPTFVNSRVATGRGEVSLAPMNVLEGSTLIVEVQAESAMLFVTDSAGNTFTAMPSRYIDEEIQWERSEPGAVIGEPRTIAFSSPMSSASILAPGGSRVGSIIIGGVTDSVIVRKNQRARAVLNTVTVQIDPSIRYEGPPTSLLLEIPNIPTVDGIQPHSWVYGIDVHIDGTYSFSIRRNSVAFRSANYKSPMPALASGEELAMAAPGTRVVLRVSVDNPTASANIDACFLLRDFREPTPSTTRPNARAK